MSWEYDDELPDEFPSGLVTVVFGVIVTGIAVVVGFCYWLVDRYRP